MSDGFGVGPKTCAIAVGPGTADGRVDAADDVLVVDDFLHGVDVGLDGRIGPVAVGAEQLVVRVDAGLAEVDVLEPVGQVQSSLAPRAMAPGLPTLASSAALNSSQVLGFVVTPFAV